MPPPRRSLAGLGRDFALLARERISTAGPAVASVEPRSFLRCCLRLSCPGLAGLLLLRLSYQAFSFGHQGRWEPVAEGLLTCAQGSVAGFAGWCLQVWTVRHMPPSRRSLAGLGRDFALLAHAQISIAGQLSPL